MSEDNKSYRIEERTSPGSMGVQIRIVRKGVEGPWVEGTPSQAWKSYKKMRKVQDLTKEVEQEPPFNIGVEHELPVKEVGYRHLQYDGRVFLLKKNKEGKKIDIQCNGCCCSHFTVFATYVCSFVSDSQYYDSNYWYKRNVWLDEEGLISFDSEPILISDWDADTDPIKKELRKTAIPASQVLDEIVKIASRESGVNLKFTNEDKTYGHHWWEAYVPLQDEDGNELVLTWNNCD